MTEPTRAPTETACSRIEWHRADDGGQVVVSVDGESVRIAVALAPDTPRAAVEAAWEELRRELDHHGPDDGPIPVPG